MDITNFTLIIFSSWKETKNNSLCMAFCWRFFHRHMAMKTMRIRTITPRTQPTIKYSMSLLRTGPFAGPAPLPPTRSGGFGGVLRSFTGYSDAPGVRFTGWSKRQVRVRSLNEFSERVFSLRNESNYCWVRILMPQKESFQVNIKNL